MEALATDFGYLEGIWLLGSSFGFGSLKGLRDHGKFLEAEIPLIHLWIFYVSVSKSII